MQTQTLKCQATSVWDLVSTFISLKLNLFPSPSRLEELFLCLNGYNTVSESQASCPSLRLLQITDNQLREWAEVRKFGQMYPSLSTLVLANNSVDSVGDTQETLQRLFPNLRSINLNNSGLRGMMKAVHIFHLSMFNIQCMVWTNGPWCCVVQGLVNGRTLKGWASSLSWRKSKQRGFLYYSLTPPMRDGASF